MLLDKNAIEQAQIYLAGYYLTTFHLPMVDHRLSAG